MSIWLESLRTVHEENSVLVLSDYLLPQETPNGLMRFIEWFGPSEGIFKIINKTGGPVSELPVSV